MEKRGWVVINIRWASALGVVAVFCSGMAAADGWVPIGASSTNATKAPLTGSIANTRHNLTQPFNGASSVMTAVARNNYGEVCVYCHTPHGANTKIKAPIWNRTINTGQYIIYDKLRTLDRPVGQPGANSLTCLSCHDGTIAIDSIINMPGSGGYKATQEDAPTVDKAWLDTWALNKGLTPPTQHAVMGLPTEDTNNPPNQSDGVIRCTMCHNNDAGIPSFTGFVLGTDLRNEHAVGIQFPVTFVPGVDFKEPTGTIVGKMKYFDVNGNSRPDTNEPRLYDTGEGPEVECASCHDPHGIPLNGPGTQFIPSFLRVSNGNVNTGDNRSSGLCLTCHDK